MIKYFPILLSKAGEFKALSALAQKVKKEVAPIIQILPGEHDRLNAFAVVEWSFEGNFFLIDFSLCIPFEKAKAKRLITTLVNSGVNVVPVIQANSDLNYFQLLSSLISRKIINEVCIRFSNTSGGFININANITSILTVLSINRSKTSILLDFGFADNYNFNTISSLAYNTIINIDHPTEYTNVIVASSSFLENLSSLTPAGRVYRLPRYEWIIWQSLIAQPNIVDFVKYGDYGTKYPYYTEANFQGSCSIKYTQVSEFIIYRGEISSNHPQGNGQYIIFSNRLVSSADFSGLNFSWGDGQIYNYASQVLADPNRKTGNAKSWVEISQNHHITLLHSIL